MCNPDTQALTQADTELSNPYQVALVLDVSELIDKLRSMKLMFDSPIRAMPILRLENQ
jgi:hypothetical protein